MLSAQIVEVTIPETYWEQQVVVLVEDIGVLPVRKLSIGTGHKVNNKSNRSQSFYIG